MPFLPDTNVWISLLKNPSGKLEAKELGTETFLPVDNRLLPNGEPVEVLMGDPFPKLPLHRQATTSLLPGTVH